MSANTPLFIPSISQTIPWGHVTQMTGILPAAREIFRALSPVIEATTIAFARGAFSFMVFTTLSVFTGPGRSKMCMCSPVSDNPDA
jgi:hypothetical protein